MVLHQQEHHGTFPPDFQRNLSKLMGLIVQGSRCSTLDQVRAVLSLMSALSLIHFLRLSALQLF